MSNRKSSRRSFLSETGKLAGGGWLAMNTPMLLAAGHAAEQHRDSGEDWVNISEHADDLAMAGFLQDRGLRSWKLPEPRDTQPVYL